MDLRDATSLDVEAIADIYRYYVRTNICTLEEHEPSLDAIRNDFSKIFAAGEPFIVAIEPRSSRLRGYAYAGPFNERSGYNHTCEDSIYIHHDYCRNGLGKQLLQALLDKVKVTSRATQVIAKMSIAPEQAVENLSSCRLHMSLGFRPAGRLRKVGRKFGQWVDVVILQLDLENTIAMEEEGGG